MENKDQPLIIDISESIEQIAQVLDHLSWCCYKANRDYGVSHELLRKHGIGNEDMKRKYENEKK